MGETEVFFHITLGGVWGLRGRRKMSLDARLHNVASDSLIAPAGGEKGEIEYAKPSAAPCALRHSSPSLMLGSRNMK